MAKNETEIVLTAGVVFILQSFGQLVIVSPEFGSQNPFPQLIFTGTGVGVGVTTGALATHTFVLHVLSAPQFLYYPLAAPSESYK